jgi:hypothetical protein
MNPFFFPGEKKRGADLVINSNSWEMSFLSGEKKTGAASEPWAGPASAGKKKWVPQIGPNPGSGTALAAQPKFSKHQENVGKTRYSGKC